MGREAALEGVLDQVEFLIGTAGREAIQLLVKHAPERQVSLAATLHRPGHDVLWRHRRLHGAAGRAGHHLGSATQARPGNFEMIRDRFLSFAMVLVIGFLLLVSLMTSALLTALTNRFSGFVPAELKLAQAEQLRACLSW